MPRSLPELDADREVQMSGFSNLEMSGFGHRVGPGGRHESRRSRITLRARITTRESRGAVFIPFHFREASANPFTFDELDPTGKIPGFKYCAVRVTRATA